MIVVPLFPFALLSYLWHIISPFPSLYPFYLSCLISWLYVGFFMVLLLAQYRDYLIYEAG